MSTMKSDGPATKTKRSTMKTSARIRLLKTRMPRLRPR
jgi:hypothetical protein